MPKFVTSLSQEILDLSWGMIYGVSGCSKGRKLPMVVGEKSISPSAKGSRIGEAVSKELY